MPSVAVPMLILPPSVVGYIASFIKVNFDSTLLLNMYKAFESIAYESVACEGYEDPLCYYKADVQSYIAYLAEDGVIFDERDANCGLTQRDIMYLFDCLYCESTVIMYGEATYEDLGDICIVNTVRAQHIDHEFLDCSEMTETLALPGIQFGLSDDLNIKMYKYIRLLEEALRLKSTALLAYMKDKLVISPDMLLYIYIKHNHQVYAPDWYSLAADDLLLEMLKEVGVLPAVLGLAISGQRPHHAYSEAALKNVVHYNFEVVKKIVPRYIDSTSAVIPYENFVADSPFGFSTDLLTPRDYWQTTYKYQVQVSALGEETKIIEVVGSEEIGAYLLEMENK